MKTLIYWLTALIIVSKAHADSNRYPMRTVVSEEVSLQPLFSWWTFACQTTNVPMDITQVDTNVLAAISNVWLHLPPRPLMDWYKVTASEGSITEVGNMWKVDATIEPAPMMLKHQIILLQHPPVKEIEDFKAARASLLSLQNAQLGDTVTEQHMQSNIQTQADAVRTNAIAAANGAAPPISQDISLQQASEVTASNLTAIHTRMQDRDTQMAPFGQYLAQFPDTNVYWLDHFALRTGKVINGLEVYDLGKAAGLTY